MATHQKGALPGFSVRAILVHAACWALLIAYELGLLYYAAGKLESPSVYLLFYAINIGFFYSLYFLLNAIFDRPRINLWRIAWLTLMIPVYVLVKVLANYYTEGRSAGFAIYIREPAKLVSTILFRAGHFILLAVFYWAAGHIAIFRRRASEAERDRMMIRAEKAELETLYFRARAAYLQQQINPHLMFNALNFVYSKVLNLSPEAGRCLVLLSDILRFSLEAKGEDGKCPLEEEMLQLENLLELNQFRFDGALYVNIHIDGDFSSLRIIPLILLTLAENLFKHGDLSKLEHPACIRIAVTSSGTLTFLSSNLKKHGGNHKRSTGTGLENIRVRLQDAYPETAYNLTVTDHVDIFETKLNISL